MDRQIYNEHLLKSFHSHPQSRICLVLSYKPLYIPYEIMKSQYYLCQYWFLTGISLSPFFLYRHQLLIPKFLCPQRKCFLFLGIPCLELQESLCSLPIATWQIRLKPLIRPSIVSSLQSPFPILVFINMVAVYTRISHFSIFVTILRSFSSLILCAFHLVVNGLQNGDVISL